MGLIKGHSPMKMCPGHPPRFANFANRCTLLNQIALVNQKGAHVGINAGQAKAMIKHQGFARVEHIVMNKGNNTVRWGHDDGPGGACNIGAVMGVFRFTIENSL